MNGKYTGRRMFGSYVDLGFLLSKDGCTLLRATLYIKANTWKTEPVKKWMKERMRKASNSTGLVQHWILSARVGSRDEMNSKFILQITL